MKKTLKKILGPRTLKTALATALAIYIGFMFDLRTPLFAGISAIVAMTSSVFDSFKVNINRMIATIIGAIVACFLQYIDFTNFWAIAIGIILIINICIGFNWKKSISLTCIVFIAIVLYEEADYVMYAWHRVVDTFVGLIVGFLVNYFIYPPNRVKFLLTTYKDTLTEFDIAFKTLITKNGNIKIQTLVDDIHLINEELKNIEMDSRIKSNDNLSVADVARINYEFFNAFSLITQLAEKNKIPELTEDNKYKIKKYFDYNIEIPESDYNEDYEIAFNYLLNDLIDTLYSLKTSVEKLENLIKN